MVNKYTAPYFNGDAFNCPYCEAYAHQEWYNMAKVIIPEFRGVGYGSSVPDNRHSGRLDDFKISHCSKCGNYSVWFKEEMIFPKVANAPLPFEDMPEDVKEDFLEAREIVNASPRGAGGLLRLALQKLMPHLGEEGKNLNKDIGNLVKKGLPVEIQQALDSLRVIGNESVHPGDLDLKDDFETVQALFNVINFIVDRMIIQPKKIEELYAVLPASKKEGIENRDNV